jgi:hypothetical protein
VAALYAFGVALALIRIVDNYKLDSQRSTHRAKGRQAHAAHLAWSEDF